MFAHKQRAEGAGLIGMTVFSEKIGPGSEWYLAEFGRWQNNQ